MDKRKFNGGNSTKAKGLDKRKNEYKEVLESALTKDDLVKVVKMLHNRAIKDEDVTAGKILLEYYVGKPTQVIENNNVNHNLNQDLTEAEAKAINKALENKY